MDLARRKLCSWFLLPTGCSGGVERYRLEGASPGFDEGGWVGFIMKAVELDSDLWGYCNPPGTSGIEWSEVERAWVSEESMLVRDEIANFSLSLSYHVSFPASRSNDSSRLFSISFTRQGFQSPRDLYNSCAKPSPSRARVSTPIAIPRVKLQITNVCLSRRLIHGLFGASNKRNRANSVGWIWYRNKQRLEQRRREYKENVRESHQDPNSCAIINSR